MTIDLTLREIENLIMMADHCQRHYGHGDARSAVAKLRRARVDALGLFAKEMGLSDGREATTGTVRDE